jgi:hypothetical protein
MVLLHLYVICRFVIVPSTSEEVDFKNIFCGCYAITDRWKLVWFHVVLSIIMLWQMWNIVRWNWHYCNIMVEWASFLSLCTGGSGYLGQYSSYPVCATSYLSRQMHRTTEHKVTSWLCCQVPTCKLWQWAALNLSQQEYCHRGLHLFAVSGYLDFRVENSHISTLFQL